MRLRYVELNNYKRFKGQASLSITTKLVALLGPDEVGKSSLLDALQHLNHEKSFRLEGPSTETTRGEAVQPGSVAIRAIFSLEEHDRQAIAELTTTKITYCEIEKTYSGTLRIKFAQPLSRNLSTRRQVLTALAEVAAAYPEALPAVQTPASETSIDAVLESHGGDLSNSQKKILSNYSEQISEAAKANPEKLNALASSLQVLNNFEKGSVEASASQALMRIRPKFLFFSAEDRDLSSEYDISAYFGDKDKQKIPQALTSLANLSELDLQKLYDARRANDEGPIETLMNRANERLAIEMKSRWLQSHIVIRLRFDGWRLILLVSRDSREALPILVNSTWETALLVPSSLYVQKSHPRVSINGDSATETGQTIRRTDVQHDPVG